MTETEKRGNVKPSLWSKFAIGFIVAIPLLLGLDFLELLSFLNLFGASHAVTSATEVRAEAEGTLSDLKDVELATMGTSPSAETEQIQAWESALSAVQNDLQVLGRSTDVDSSRQERLRKFEGQVRQQINSLEQAKGPASPEKPKDKAQEMAQAKAREQKLDALRPPMRKSMEDIRTAMEDLNTAQLQLLSAGNAQERKAERKVVYLSSLGALVAIWLVAVAALMLRRTASERKWAGLERRMHAQVLATLPMGVCVADDAGVIFYSNPAEDGLLGYGPEELMGKNISDFLGTPPDENVHVAEDIGNKLKTQGFWGGDVTTVKKNKTTFKSHTYVVAMTMAGKIFRILLQEEVNEPGSA